MAPHLESDGSLWQLIWKVMAHCGSSFGKWWLVVATHLEKVAHSGSSFVKWWLIVAAHLEKVIAILTMYSNVIQ